MIQQEVRKNAKEERLHRKGELHGKISGTQIGVLHKTTTRHNPCQNQAGDCGNITVPLQNGGSHRRFL